MSGWPERTINSLEDVQRLSDAMGARWPNSDRCLFRGQSSAQWSLQPSLARELTGSRLNWYDILRLERELANHFRQEAHRTLPQAVLSVHDYVLDWWPFMRHHGAPTRLLDWSLSPYVALYFAVASRWDEDGTLWWFRGTAADNLMQRRYPKVYKLHAENVFGSHDGASFFESEPPAILFYFELRRTIERIGNQQGFFTLCLDPRADHADVLQELAEYGDGPHCEKLTVPNARKPELLRDLHLMNVTGKSMFPGLDGLGLTLTELTRLSIRFGVP